MKIQTSTNPITHRGILPTVAAAFTSLRALILVMLGLIVIPTALADDTTYGTYRNNNAYAVMVRVDVSYYSAYSGYWSWRTISNPQQVVPANGTLQYVQDEWGWYPVDQNSGTYTQNGQMNYVRVHYENVSVLGAVTFTLTTSASGGGSVDPYPSATYNSNATATVRAIPHAGYYFAGWSGAASGTSNPLSLVMDASKSVTANFASQSYTLTTNASGSGSVTAGGTYSYGTVRSISASPGTGYHFAGWTGAATGTSNPVNITIDSNKTLTANFTANSYTLTTNTSGSGSVTAGGTYSYGTVRSISASPGTGYYFAGWSGAATGTSNPVNITVDSNKTLTANFTANSYTLTTTTSGSGSVTAGGSYSYGTVRSITATAGTGYTFSGWSGAASGTSNPVNITVDSNKTLTANFSANSYTLTTTTTGSGSVTAGGTYPYGTVRTITATPGTGHSFDGWSGAASGWANTINITIDANKTIRATFVPNSYEISASTVPAGLADIQGASDYDYGQTATLTAPSVAGYVFTGWSGGISSTANPLSFTVDSAKALIANYVASNYTVSGVTAPAGLGTISGTGAYSYGQNATLSAPSVTGYTFTGWSGDLSGATNPQSLTVNGNKAVTASYSANNYTLTTNTSGSGSVTAGGTYPYGTVRTITATAGTGYTFSGWSGAASGTTNPVNITVDSNKTLTANFTANSCTVTTAVNGPGSVSGGGNYTYGQAASLTATPSTGHTFAGWSGDLSGATNPQSLTVNGNKSVTASFVPNTYTVTTNASGSGTVSGGGNYTHGQTASLSASPFTGWTFTNWTGDLSGAANPQSLTVNGNKSVTAVFTVNSYTLTVNTSGVGSATGGGGYTHGQTASVTAIPATGWRFAGFSGAITSTTSPATVLMDGSKAVTATFVRQTYTLTTSVSGAGSITAGGTYPAPDPTVTAVTLIATPTATSRFTGFTGTTGATVPTQNADGTASLYTPMTMDRSIIANFVSKLPQSITFIPPGARNLSEGSFDLVATASSGLPVSFVVVSGPGSLSGARLTFTGPGQIIVEARQGGNVTYLPAPPVQQTVIVADAPRSRLKEDEGQTKINDGENEEGNFGPSS